MAKTFKRFCCRFSIASGVHFIGYSNIGEICLLIATQIAAQTYPYLALIILPLLVIHAYLKMVKKDSIKKRKRFYYLYVITKISITSVQISQLVQARYKYQSEAHDSDPDMCEQHICNFGKQPYFSIFACLVAVKACWNLYASLILRQHWLNRLHGQGDARALRSKEIPAYL